MMMCPHCKGTTFERALVDVGCGLMEGPAVCGGCGWREDDETEVLDEIPDDPLVG